MVPGSTSDRSSAPALTGPVTRAQLASHPGWEHLRGQGYNPDPDAVATIREHAAGTEFLVFIGTWCPDCKRHVPRFLKLMDLADIPESQYRLHGLDRAKEQADEQARQWNAHYVPTFILLQSGRELGRIIEKPATTLEGDIAAILATQ